MIKTFKCWHEHYKTKRKSWIGLPKILKTCQIFFCESTIFLPYSDKWITDNSFAVKLFISTRPQSWLKWKIQINTRHIPKNSIFIRTCQLICLLPSPKPDFDSSPSLETLRKKKETIFGQLRYYSIHVLNVALKGQQVRPI